ncbi:hypothetical protein ACFYUJ_14235 [Streptomyces sp. NPDC004520]|uniref:hypothetical protein n=1 Tax=Streptomyces sp. NPDC004520 TaxID=3364702 RepID=UPI0036AAE05A
MVDESSFDFRGLTEEALTDAMDAFNDALEELRETRTVSVSPWWFDAECAEGRDLHEVLYEGGTPKAGRDARLRMARLMDRCPSWDPDLTGLPDEVSVNGSEPCLALSVGHSWWHVGNGYSVGCLVFPVSGRRGWHSVTAREDKTSEHIERDVFFFGGPQGLPEFWRSLFAREGVRENEFFERAREAFPGLVFAESLAFRRFDGGYGQMRDWVVHVLTVVNDHFADAVAKHAGVAANVQAELGHHGLVLSPESPNTRSKARIMAQRDVDHVGETYRCEWHAKKEPNRNRVHFSLPEQRLGGRILIGIFVDHLDTE